MRRVFPDTQDCSYQTRHVREIETGDLRNDPYVDACEREPMPATGAL
jgi:hypothetical protein